MGVLMIPQPRVALRIREATMDDLPFLDRLQKLHGKAVGYFPTGQFRGYIEQRAVLIAEEARPERHEGTEAPRHEGPDVAGSDPSCLRASVPSCLPLGYLISKDRYLKRDELGVVYQLNVEPGRQRGYVGAALLREAFERSAYGCKLYCCWCAKDLAANRFWEAMGFVPLAYRAGSEKKQRTHIFWQKRINQGDDVTPWWYPFQTNGGAMRADRLAFPIPPGTHWSEVEAVAVPTVGGHHGGTETRRAKKAKVVEAPKVAKVAVMIGGKVKYIERPTNTSPFETSTPVAAPAPAEETAIVVKEKAERPTVDPAFLAANRELRDRYLERLNAEPWVLELPAAKYNAARLAGASGARGSAALASRETPLLAA